MKKIGRGNSLKTIRNLKDHMEKEFGVKVTKGSLFRILSRDRYLELYGAEEWLTQLESQKNK